jgi:ABC-type phosphate transport system ATPase subunit
MNISSSYIIETHAMSKIYKNVHALRSLDLRVQQNSIFGFLGPNGAGKTTTIKLLLGLIRPLPVVRPSLGWTVSARVWISVPVWVTYLRNRISMHT